MLIYFPVETDLETADRRNADW